MTARYLKYLEDFQTIERVTLIAPQSELKWIQEELVDHRFYNIRPMPHPTEHGNAIVTAEKRIL